MRHFILAVAAFGAAAMFASVATADVKITDLVTSKRYAPLNAPPSIEVWVDDADALVRTQPHPGTLFECCS